MKPTTMDLSVATMYCCIMYDRMPDDVLTMQASYVLLSNMREASVILLHALCALYGVADDRAVVDKDVVNKLKEEAFDEDVLAWLECTDPFDAESLVLYYKRLLAALSRAIFGWKRTLVDKESKDYKTMCACEEEVAKCVQRVMQ